MFTGGTIWILTHGQIPVSFFFSSQEVYKLVRDRKIHLAEELFALAEDPNRIDRIHPLFGAVRAVFMAPGGWKIAFLLRETN